MESVALNFFIYHFTILGRDRGSSRGLFESIVPVLSAEHVDSSASLAVSAMALTMYSKWRKDPEIDRAASPVLGRALRRIRSDLRANDKGVDLSMLLAILVLQFLESFLALYHLQKAPRIHQNGALASMKQMKATTAQTDLSDMLTQYVVNVEVASAIRERRMVDPELRERHKAGLGLRQNPNQQLDSIGIDVARLQCQCDILMESDQTNDTTRGISLEAMRLYFETKSIQYKLGAWRRSIAADWESSRWVAKHYVTPPIDMYRGTCEVYHSTQIASILNTWRSHQLTVAAVLAFLQFSIARASVHSPLTTQTDACSLNLYIQDLVDGVCYSVPFHIGNRKSRSSLADFEDRSLFFPSHHNNSEAVVTSCRMSESEHRGSVIAQGAWHILSPLSHLVTLLSSQYGPYFAPVLRHGQADWICQQLIRTVLLLGIQWNMPFQANTTQSMRDSSQDPKAQPNVERLASLIRHSLTVTSGS